MRKQITADELGVLRRVAYERLDSYINGLAKKEDIFKWAKEIVISQNFEQICEQDKLLGDIIQVLFELHHKDGRFDPSIELFSKYKEKLERALKR